VYSLAHEYYQTPRVLSGPKRLIYFSISTLGLKKSSKEKRAKDFSFKLSF